MRFQERFRATAQRIRFRFAKRFIQILGHATPGPLVSALNLVSAAVRNNLDDGAFAGEQDPVAVGVGKFLPRAVEVIAQGLQDVAEVLARPGARPRSNRAVADRQPRFVHHRRFRSDKLRARSTALWAHAIGRVGAEGVRSQASDWGFGLRIARQCAVIATPGIQQTNNIRGGANRAHRRASPRRRSLLLKRNRRR